MCGSGFVGVISEEGATPPGTKGLGCYGATTAGGGGREGEDVVVCEMRHLEIGKAVDGGGEWEVRYRT